VRKVAHRRRTSAADHARGHVHRTRLFFSFSDSWVAAREDFRRRNRRTAWARNELICSKSAATAFPNLNRAIAKAPLFGHGLGYAYQLPFGKARTFTATLGTTYAHNLYLWWLAQSRGGAHGGEPVTFGRPLHGVRTCVMSANSERMPLHRNNFVHARACHEYRRAVHEAIAESDAASSVNNWVRAPRVRNRRSGRRTGKPICARIDVLDSRP
jgi:hypothetical protein